MTRRRNEHFDPLPSPCPQPRDKSKAPHALSLAFSLLRPHIFACPPHADALPAHCHVPCAAPTFPARPPHHPYGCHVARAAAAPQPFSHAPAARLPHYPHGCRTPSPLIHHRPLRRIREKACRPVEAAMSATEGPFARKRHLAHIRASPVILTARVGPAPPAVRVPPATSRHLPLRAMLHAMRHQSLPFITSWSHFSLHSSRQHPSDHVAVCRPPCGNALSRSASFDPRMFHVKHMSQCSAIKEQMFHVKHVPSRRPEGRSAAARSQLRHRLHVRTPVKPRALASARTRAYLGL